MLYPLLECRSSNRSESWDGQTPSPSIPPHPNLGATASAQGRQALPPPGGKEQDPSPGHLVPNNIDP